MQHGGVLPSNRDMLRERLFPSWHDRSWGTVLAHRRLRRGIRVHGRRSHLRRRRAARRFPTAMSCALRRHRGWRRRDSVPCRTVLYTNRSGHRRRGLRDALRPRDGRGLWAGPVVQVRNPMCRPGAACFVLGGQLHARPDLRFDTPRLSHARRLCSALPTAMSGEPGAAFTTPSRAIAPYWAIERADGGCGTVPIQVIRVR
jgi:hypothetical protein